MVGQLAEPTLIKIAGLHSKSAVSPGVREANMRRNIPLVAKRAGLGREPRTDRRAIICGYGPSLQDSWHDIRAERRTTGAVVVTTSGAHDFLIERGIVPDYHVEVDPREHKAFFTRTPHPEVKYCIASSCHPVMVDNLMAFDLTLFHTYNEESERAVLAELEPHYNMISGGGSAACRANNLFYLKGHRSFSFYGVDCSFAAEGSQHAGAHTGKKQTDILVKCGERYFRTSPTLIATAHGFIRNMTLLHRASAANNEPPIEGTQDLVEFFLHGDGMLAHMYRVHSTTETGII